MDTLPAEKENATGNTAAPSKSKPIAKLLPQDGAVPRVPLRPMAAKLPQHVAVRAVSAANKRMADRQPTASFGAAAQHGEQMRLKLCK
jgi:hypothetical protein